MTKSNVPKKSWRDVLPVHPAADMFPLMEGAEFAAFVDDVKQHDLRIPITVWQDVSTGTQYLLEGRNRLRALIDSGRELHQHYFHVVGFCENTRDPYAYVLSANIHRRHLTSEQRRELIAKLLKAQPDKSNRAIAKQTKADDKTVGKVRRELEGRAEIPHVDAVEDTKGRKQPTRKPKSAPHNAGSSLTDAVTEINIEFDAADKADRKFDRHRIEAGHKLLMLRKRIEAGEAGKDVEWWAWYRQQHFIKKRRDAEKVMPDRA